VKKGTSPLELTIDSLENKMGLTIGTPTSNDGIIIVEDTSSESTITVGSVWFKPDSQDCYKNDTVTTEILVNSGEQLVACYGIDIAYDTNVIDYVSIEAGTEGFVSAVNPTAGKLITSGFDAVGKGPGDSLHLLTVKWIAVGEGTSQLEMTINDLSDDMLFPIGTPTSNDGIIIVEDTLSDSTIGSVWFQPDSQNCTVNDTVSTEVRMNSGEQLVSAYGIEVAYDTSVIKYDTTIAGTDGFIAAINPLPGNLIIDGFDAAGKGPGNSLHLLTIKWIAVDTGASQLDMTVNDLTDELSVPIGTPTAHDGIINVTSGGIEENGTSVKVISVPYFHSGINIKYNIEEKERVKVEIHNILGQRLAKLKDGTSPSGKYNLTWNGQPGIYFVRVEIGNKVYRKKALIIR
ncbi:T9SS type A sorting domain-containing protein, partial [candidate division WOR-3 bacterium]|nr:T9SS type A sorting domain-containing protein [candidate division WOR-3 bacterium]